MLKLFAGLTLSLLTLSSAAHAGNARTQLRGGALGIAQCYYISGGKTKVEWWVATRSKEEQINFVDFTIMADDNSERGLYGPIFPTAKYKDSVIFDDQKQAVTITGQAYSINLNAIRTFSLKEPLKVNCSN